MGALAAAAEPLGTLCEASAARFVACPKDPAAGTGDQPCLLVADNEISDRLFLYRRRADGTFGSERAIPLVLEDGSTQGAQVGDIEALEVADGIVWAVGSHGRRKWSGERHPGDAKQCGVVANRLAIFRGAWQPDTPMGQIRGTRIKTRKKQWHELLGPACESRAFRLAAGDAKGRALAAAACRVFDLHQRQATQDRDACESAFQIEGAALLPSSDGGRRLWLGVRSPPVQGKAVLLRLEQGERLAFDGIALLDLGAERGVRELEYADGRLWIIAGPAGDSQGTGFDLVATRAGSIESGAIVAAMEPIARLPARSEALAVSANGETILVVTDGKAPEHAGGSCKIASEIFDVAR